MAAFLKFIVLFIFVFMAMYIGLHLYFQDKYIEIFVFYVILGFATACFMTWIERRF